VTKVVTGAIRFVEAVHGGVWLGLLSRQQLDRVNHAFYSGPTPYADDAFNRRGLTPREEVPVVRHLADARSVLVLGAGGGREVLALSGMGHRVDGFECNDVLVDYGNAFLTREGSAARIRRVPPDECPRPDTPWDGALVGWGVYIHMIPRARRIEFLEALRRAVVPGGPVVLGFCARREGAFYFRAVAAIANPLRRLRRRPPVELGDKLEPTYEHHFTEAEIIAELESAGFGSVEYVDVVEPGQALIVATGRRDPTRVAADDPR